MRYAVIDLGSNTFHILIVEASGTNDLSILHKERSYVKLASGGIEKIEPDAYRRGMDCLRLFKNQIDHYEVDRVKAFGTATIRSASNGPQFTHEVKERYGIEILSISGEEEARLITEGVKLATAPSSKPQLIMDIGGGSVEFIILKHHEMVWANSYNVGISILKKQFHNHDPITLGEIDQINRFLEKELQEVCDKILHFGPIEHLIGASGSFEVLKNIFDPPVTKPHYYQLAVRDIEDLIDELISLDHQQRLEHLHIPNERVDLIVVATILMRFIIHKSNAKDVLISDYALKEGAIAEMMRNSNF